ncbi:MAG: heavy-metal-associated domain-containing protein [Syntrophothermus sp.]
MSRQETTLRVDGMTCGHCAGTVEKAVKSLKGVERASVDLAKGSLQVAYDPDQVGISDFKRAVEEAGYEVVG